MDFVELPDKVDFEEIPDLGIRDYDHGDFETYPQRQGWNLQALLDGNFAEAYDSWDTASQDFGPALLAAFNGLNLDVLEERDFQSVYNDWNRIAPTLSMDSEQEHAIKALANNMFLSVVGGFIQTWLILGTLGVVLRRPVSRLDVVQVKEAVEENGKMVKRSCLTLGSVFPECVRQFRDHLETDADWAADVLRTLRIGITFLDDLARKMAAPVRHYFLPRSVEANLLVLLNTFDQHQALHNPRHLRANMYSCEALEQEIKTQRKWCPHTIYRLRATGGAQSLYYVSLLPSFAVYGVHENCDEAICLAFNIDNDTYRPVHSEGCCRHGDNGVCPDISISEHDLVLILEAGGYPLVSLEEGGLKLVPYQHGVEYVAISHVWSDGRGNPTQNSLPLCQLKTIQQWVSRSAHDGMLFWIDTLCVPKNEPHRNSAIMRMAETYQAATHVLVLSEELLAFNLPKSPLQALYMMFHSKWMTRLWTLQEAVLSRRLLFQFRDHAIAFSTLSDAILDSPEVPMVNEHWLSRIAGLNMLTQMRLFEGQESDHSLGKGRLSFNDLIWALQPRTSSRGTDASICASILMGSDLHPVLAASDDMKMQAFWTCRTEVPARVLWARGPRLEQEGLRWAPRDLLHPLTRQSFLGSRAPESASARLSKEGLVISGVSAFLLETITVTDESLPTTVHDSVVVVTDFDLVMKIHAEDEKSNWHTNLGNRQFLLLLEELEYAKAVRRCCVAFPSQRLKTSTYVGKPLQVIYHLPMAIEIVEMQTLTVEQMRSPAAKITQVFEPSQSWLVT